jgi:hypothetical protein
MKKIGYLCKYYNNLPWEVYTYAIYVRIFTRENKAFH